MTRKSDTVTVRRSVLQQIAGGLDPHTDSGNLLRVVLENDGRTPGFTWPDDPSETKPPDLARLRALAADWRYSDELVGKLARAVFEAEAP